MGIVSSADTRRISFDNKIAEGPSLAIQSSIGDNMEDVLQIESISIENDSDLNFISEPKAVQETVGDNEYWNQRLEALKKEHLLINKIVESEYEKTVAHARKYYETPTTLTIEKIKKVKPCLDWRLKLTVSEILAAKVVKSLIPDYEVENSEKIEVVYIILNTFNKNWFEHDRIKTVELKQKDIMQCYEDNPHQPLVCSGAVQAFTECVASCRSSEN